MHQMANTFQRRIQGKLGDDALNDELCQRLCSHNLSKPPAPAHHQS